MGVFRQFPYSNFHEMNMDEIIKIIKNMLEEWAQYHAEWDAWMNQMNDDWSNYQEVMNEAWQNMQNFINNYFDNLNVQNEINNKITTMVNSGEFATIVEPYIPPRVSAWLTEHITQPVGVVIDTSLTVSGACADAKATGDAIIDIKSDINGITYRGSSSANQNNPAYEDGVWTDAQTWNPSATYRHSKYPITVKTGDVIRFVTDNDINYKGLALYNDNTLVGVTSENGDYPATRTFITIDSVDYYYYTYTIPSGINKISYQRKATIDGVADMVTINSGMPTTYTAFVAAFIMTNKLLGTHENISDFDEAVRNEFTYRGSSSANQNNPAYEDGVWTDAQTWNPSATYRHSKYPITVKTGDVIRFVTDNDINYKGLALYNGNTLVGVTSQNGDYPTDSARTYITIDGVGYFYYTYTIPSGINKISYQRKATIDGVADMVTINSEMPTTYTAYVEAFIMTNKLLGTHENILDFDEAVKNVINVLADKKVGFLGDSYTDVSYYYGQKIADETGMIAVANGKQGSRIFSDNSWTSGGQTVTALSFWHRINLFTDNDFDAICIFGGINDASTRSIYETNLGSIDDVALTTAQVEGGTVPSTFYQAYKTVVEMLWEKYPTLPLLIIIPPHQLNASYNPSLKSYMGINAIRNAELSIAEYYGIPICDLYKSCQELNNYSANVSAYRLRSDDVHPNNAGQTAIAKYVRQALIELLVQ